MVWRRCWDYKGNNKFFSVYVDCNEDTIRRRALNRGDGVKAIEDSDYSSKSEFARDLRANEYKVLSVNDNRDLYVVDHSDFGNLAQLKKEMLFYKRMWEDAKRDNPDSTLFKDDYEQLKKIYDEAMNQSL